MNKLKIELFCGNNAREIAGYDNICIDIVKTSITTIISNLGFDSSWVYKYENSVDLIQCVDGLEHIPRQVYIPQYSWNQEKNEWDLFNNVTYKTLYPFITLMNDIWTVLRHEGILYIETPNSDEAFYRDVTHINRLCADFYQYFENKGELYHSQGLITCNFKLISQEFRAYKWTSKDIMCVKLQAIKQQEENSVSQININKISNKTVLI